MLQIDLADLPDDVRRDHLHDELDRVLEKMSGSQRKAFLEALESRFPSWDSGISTETRRVAPTAQSPTDERELLDPSFLVRKLVDLAPDLPEADKRAVMDKLELAGFKATATGGGWRAESDTRLRDELKLGGDDMIDPSNLVDLAGMLAGLVQSLDQLAWSTWRTVSPKSQLRRRAPLNKTMARFASGDPDVPRGEIADDLEKLRQLTASLISAMSQAGPLAYRQVSKLAPTQIESIVEGEGRSFMKSKDVSCWQKYCELATGLDEVSFEQALLQGIAEYAESLIRGLGR
jgi:hypothetical protein